MTPPVNTSDGDEDSWGSDSSASSSSSTTSLATTTLLGLPDGPVSSLSDLKDPQVSRLGGLPTFLSSLTSSPPIAATQCANCGHTMELLVQLYAPLEGSVDDRVVYVLGCGRACCQGEKTKGRCVLFYLLRIGKPLFISPRCLRFFILSYAFVILLLCHAFSCHTLPCPCPM